MEYKAMVFTMTENDSGVHAQAVSDILDNMGYMHIGAKLDSSEVKSIISHENGTYERLKQYSGMQDTTLAHLMEMRDRYHLEVIKNARVKG